MGSRLALMRLRLEKPKKAWFDAPCPFLFCQATERHSHRICEDCDALRYGNASCARCRRMAAELGDDR